MLRERLGRDRGVVPPIDPDGDPPRSLLGAPFAERLVDVGMQEWEALVAEAKLGVPVLVVGVAGVGEVLQQHPRGGRLATQWREGGDGEVHDRGEPRREVEVAVLPAVAYAAQQESWLPQMRILVPTSLSISARWLPCRGACRRRRAPRLCRKAAPPSSSSG